jgi:hypothetical protein
MTSTLEPIQIFLNLDEENQLLQRLDPDLWEFSMSSEYVLARSGEKVVRCLSEIENGENRPVIFEGMEEATANDYDKLARWFDGTEE